LKQALDSATLASFFLLNTTAFHGCLGEGNQPVVSLDPGQGLQLKNQRQIFSILRKLPSPGSSLWSSSWWLTVPHSFWWGWPGSTPSQGELVAAASTQEIVAPFLVVRAAGDQGDTMDPADPTLRQPPLTSKSGLFVVGGRR
jgi:hypothetical protein